jgi:molybdate transport system substrate-binding protein
VHLFNLDAIRVLKFHDTRAAYILVTMLGGRRAIGSLVAWALFCSAFSLAQTSTLRVAAASDLYPALKELTPAFEKAMGAKVEIVSGSSGNFFAQIQNGAPFDVFLSADDNYPRKLKSSGAAENLVTYAEGSIVLWIRNDFALDLSKGMNALLESSVRRIAIANPAHAPYGRAAISAMEHFNLLAKLRVKLVFGENVSQAVQFVQAGSADVGIVALSLALSPALRSQGRYWQVPQEAYPRMKQVGAVIASSKNKTAANAFLAFLKSPSAQSILKKYGFRSPDGATP